MGRYFLDLEFTNGNYYLADIIELALLAEHSGNIFHSYVRIHYLIPTRVKELLNISDDLLATAGCSFKDTIASLSAFLHDEQKRSDTRPIIIAHAGFSFDFPILFANFIKHKITQLNVFKECLFADSLLVFKDNGYKQRLGLDSLCQQFGLTRCTHSAIDDVRLLKEVFQGQTIGSSRTFDEIMFNLHQKLPVPITKVYAWARKCHSSKDLEVMLTKFVKVKTALNGNQMFKIAHWYFKDRYVMCK